ncbi:MAG TPA: GNAT family N-acetyltransferase [Devosiaceae bacterium]|jgi:GNAT superfamily N-acetyltransferase|nr:GNAT family N-acetyltransferase [Devosiaceae bacterium]
MTRLAYRSATLPDLPLILGLIVDDTVEPSIDDPAAAHPGYAAALAAIDADPNQEMLVAEFEGEPIGCFQLSYIPGLMRQGMWRGLIEAVHVRSDRRNSGYGSEMMRWAIQRCRERGCGLVQLTSNKARHDAHRFYVRLGFAQSHEGFKLLL